MWAWGRNTYGQLGNGSTTDASRPQQVPGLTTIAKVAASWQTSYAVTTDGTLLAWGDNSGGLLGKGTSSGYFASPGPVPGITGVSRVAPGYAETLAIAGPGSSLWAWGANTYGQAGDGTTTAHYSPSRPAWPASSRSPAGCT